MRFLAIVVVLILELCVLALALSEALSGLGGFSADILERLSTDAGVPTTEGWKRGYWVALAALPILHWILAITVYRRRKVITFKTSPTESLSITKRAIIDTVKDELNSVPAVVRHKVDVQQVGPLAVDLTLDLRVKPIENIPMLQARLAKSIRRTLSDILGIENIRKIKIDVRSIAGRRKAKRESIPVARRLMGPRAEEKESRGLEHRPAESRDTTTVREAAAAGGGVAAPVADQREAEHETETERPKDVELETPEHETGRSRGLFGRRKQPEATEVEAPRADEEPFVKPAEPSPTPGFGSEAEHVEPGLHGAEEAPAIEVEPPAEGEPERITQDDVRDYEQVPDSERRS